VDGTVTPFAAWENFYVIVGSSAAALTGLQFVVVALIPELGVAGSSREVAAFGSPTVVHFSAVLLIAAILSAPWHQAAGPSAALAAAGLAGVVYGVIVLKRALSQTGYRPVLEDWVWHTVLPFLAYSSLIVAAVSMHSDITLALFPVAGSSLLLLFIGIHNAWDTVIYIAFERAEERKESPPEPDAVVPAAETKARVPAQTPAPSDRVEPARNYTQRLRDESQEALDPDEKTLSSW
jgi:hypothetical protein